MPRQSPILLLLAAFAAGCVNHRNFAPRENQNGCGPGGQPAAVYPIQAGDAQGELRLWSGGSDAAGDEVTEVHVGFEVENVGALPLRIAIEDVRCDEILVGGQRLENVPIARFEGQPAAQPGAVARLDVWFRPGTGRPRDVTGFAVRFQVRAGETAVLTQVTPFAPFVPARDPLHDDPWFWRPGFAFGWYGWYHRC